MLPNWHLLLPGFSISLPKLWELRAQKEMQVRPSPKSLCWASCMMFPCVSLPLLLLGVEPFCFLLHNFWVNTDLLWGFPGGSMVKNPPVNAGDGGLIPGSGRSPGGGNDNSLQYTCLENPMDRGAWWATVHGVTKSQTRLKQLSTHHCVCGWGVWEWGNVRHLSKIREDYFYQSTKQNCGASLNSVLQRAFKFPKSEC